MPIKKSFLVMADPRAIFCNASEVPIALKHLKISLVFRLPFL